VNEILSPSLAYPYFMAYVFITFRTNACYLTAKIKENYSLKRQ
jgi:hypothetical protein